MYGRPLVSVTMAARNAESFIRAAIESVLRQDFKNFELIIVDDCSDDGTHAIAAEYATDPRVRLYKNSHRLGETETKNKILKLSRGQYVAALDADDVMLQGRLKDHCSFLGEHPEIGAVFGKGCNASEDLKTIYRFIAPLNKRSQPMNRSGVAAELPVGFNQGMATIRKKLIMAAGGFESSLPIGEDARLMRRIFKLTPFYYLDKLCFVYRIQRRSVCRTRLRENANAMKRIFVRRHGSKTSGFFIHDRLIKVKTASSALMRSVRWRLHFHAWQADRRKNRAKEITLRVPGARGKATRFPEPRLYKEGFLNPWGRKLIEEKKSLLASAFMSREEKGILVMASEPIRTMAALCLLNRECSYHSSGATILFVQNGAVFGDGILEPLVLPKFLGDWAIRNNAWGQFWNPLLKTRCINVPFYRAYLVGEPCPIKTILFISDVPGLKRPSWEKVRSAEARARLTADEYAKLAVETPGGKRLFNKLAAQVKAFHVRASSEKLEDVEAIFKNHAPLI